MTISSLLRNTTRDEETILAHVLKKPREYLWAYPETNVMRPLAHRFRALKKRLRAGAPLAYILGTAPFAGLTFRVTKNVLIPRPETELLVDHALALLKGTADTPGVYKSVVDIGTGSGCIIITIAKRLKRTVALHAVDISKKALIIAKYNAKKHSAHGIHFHHGDLLAPLKKSKGPLLIIANLPYLPTHSALSNGLRYEPRRALDGGKNGLDILTQLFAQCLMLDANGSKPNAQSQMPKANWSLLAEIDPRQTKKLTSKLLPHYFPNRRTKILKDQFNRDRILVIE